MDSVLLPEWAPVRAVVIAWPYKDSDWGANFEQAESCYWAMLEAFATHSDVWVLLHPSICKGSWEQELNKLIATSHKNIRRCGVLVIEGIPYNDTWIRDYGPLSLTNGYVSYQFNGWGGKYPAQWDTLVGKELEPWLGSRVVERPLFLEGGAIDTNDDQVLLANQDCVVDELRNKGKNTQAIEEVLTRELGFKEYAWLEGIQLTGDDTDGHVDTIARFVSNRCVVYSGPNSEHPDDGQLKKLSEQLTALSVKHQWELIALPTPVVTSELEPGQLLPATYANFLICNDVVFVPVYGVAQDAEALTLLAGAFGGQRKIVPVRCEALLEQHGSLHCATMQIAQLPTFS